MTPAYWIARVTVLDQDAYGAYSAAATKAFAHYGARILARGGEVVKLEGTARARNVIIEFDSMAAALACYHSPEYLVARDLRRAAAEIDLIILDGVLPVADAR